MIKRLGLAFGLTGALLYLGCILVMATVSSEGVMHLLNKLLHRFDTSSDFLAGKTDGHCEKFIISWLLGACITAIYSMFERKN